MPYLFSVYVIHFGTLRCTDTWYFCSGYLTLHMKNFEGFGGLKGYRSADCLMN